MQNLAKQTKAVMLILCFIIAGLLFFTSFFPDLHEKNTGHKITSVSNENITRISIKNGLTGDSIEIENKNTINNLINCISAYSFTEKAEQEDLNGYLYLIDFFDGDSRITRITIVDNETVNIDRVYYNSNNSQIDKCVNNFFYENASTKD